MDIRKSEHIFHFLEQIHIKYENLSRALSSGEILSNPKKYREFSKELAAIKPLESKYGEFKRLIDQYRETAQLLLSSEKEMVELAGEEREKLGAAIASSEREIEILMVSDAASDDRNVFLEIRAGAGGDEASLFVGDLMRMYSRVAERKKWKVEVVSTAYSGIGGMKEVILYVRGANAYRFYKFESGVHRVQRVPVTEASGRIHTSTVTVAVLCEADEVEVEVHSKDIRIDTYAASGPGGQHVNKTESAIRITHFPTGIVVTCQDEKSQHKNKDKAMKILMARLLEHEKNKQQESIAQNRRSQVGTGERSEKIRTYNFPQNRVTDHRISGRNFNIEFILDGALDDLVADLAEQNQRTLVDEKIKSMTA